MQCPLLYPAKVSIDLKRVESLYGKLTLRRDYYLVNTVPVVAAVEKKKT